MLVTFLDKLGGIFDNRFVVAFWMPVFLFVGALAAEVALLYGPRAVLGWWAGSTATEKALLGFGFLLTTTVLAYLLQSFAYPLVRLYVGEWPSWASRFREWAVERQRLAYQNVSGDKDEQYVQRYFGFSQDEKRRNVPTRLGNVLTAAYDYSKNTYEIEAALWWPRLTPLLPETFRNQVDAALLPLFALINLCSLSVLFSLAGGLILALLGDRPLPFALCLLGGLAFARVCYHGAVTQAGNYGQHIRVGFDLYRGELLKQMRVELPDDPQAEAKQWKLLNEWVYKFESPLQPRKVPKVPKVAPAAADGVEVADFHYDSRKAEKKPKGWTAVLSEEGAPALKLTVREGGDADAK